MAEGGETAAGATAPAPATLDDWSTALGALHDQLVAGSDAVDLARDFWERYAKIQATFAKSLEELCQSRQAKFQKLFGNVSCEPVKDLQTTWHSWVETVEKSAEQHRDMAAAVTQDIVKNLTAVRAEDVTHQLSKATLAKKVLRDLKTEESKVEMEKKKFHEAQRKALAAQDPEAGAAESAELPEEANYRTALSNYGAASDTAFGMALKGLLTEMAELEVKRVAAVTSSINRGIELLQPSPLDFTATQTAVSELTPDKITTCEITLERPPALEFVPLPQDEAATLLKAPPKQEEKGFFASLFGPSSSKKKKDDDKQAESKKDTVSVRSATPPMLDSPALEDSGALEDVQPAEAAEAAEAKEPEATASKAEEEKDEKKEAEEKKEEEDEETF